MTLATIAAVAASPQLNTTMSTEPTFYHYLASRGLVRSQRDYSSYYLGMAENYACLRGDPPTVRKGADQPLPPPLV